MNNTELLPCPFKRRQVWEDRCGGLIMIVAVSPRGEDYEVEYVHEDGYIGSDYASKAQGWKLYSDLVQRLDIDLTKCPKCGGIADNGIDRCHPPHPYNCKKCHGEGDKAVPEGWRLVPIEPTRNMLIDVSCEMTEENTPHDTMSMPDKIHIQLVNSPHGDMIRRFSTDEYFEGATTYYKKVSNSIHLDLQKLKRPEIIAENGWYSEYNAGWNECLAYIAQKIKDDQ